MTDAGSPGTEWVPRFGMLEVSSERAALIRGLFELAAFVADHPELPLPTVSAGMFPRGANFADEVAAIEQIAAALETATEFRADGRRCSTERKFGPVYVHGLATSPEYDAARAAQESYRDNVQLESPGAVSAGDAA